MAISGSRQDGVSAFHSFSKQLKTLNNIKNKCHKILTGGVKIRLRALGCEKDAGIFIF